MLPESNDEARAEIRRVIGERRLADDADEGARWRPIFEDVVARFGSRGVQAVSASAGALSVVLRRPDAQVEDALRRRYGDAVTIEYGHWAPNTG